jgi:hypothetical protein
MRTYHIIAVVAVILAGVGAQIFFTSPPAESLPLLTKNTGVDVSQCTRTPRTFPWRISTTCHSSFPSDPDISFERHLS